MTATDRDTDQMTVLVGDSQGVFAEALGRAVGREPDLEVLEPYPRSGVEAAQAGVILRPDVAVLDLWLEGVSGLAATRSIVAKSPQTRVVLLGWFHAADEIQECLEAGAAGFMSKELGFAKLVEVLRRVHAGERVVADPYYVVDWEPPAASTAGEETTGREPGEPFTVRELEVLRLLGAGLPLEDVAARLEVSRETARTHLTRVLRKTGAHSQLEAVAAARRAGYLL